MAERNELRSIGFVVRRKSGRRKHPRVNPRATNAQTQVNFRCARQLPALCRSKARESLRGLGGGSAGLGRAGLAHLRSCHKAACSASGGKPGYRRVCRTIGKGALLGLFKPRPRMFGMMRTAKPERVRSQRNARLLPTATTFTHIPRASEERAQCHTSYYQAIVHLRDDGGDRAGND